MPKIQANNIDIYYERHGKGFPLVLICDFMSHSSMWEHITSNLIDRYEVILFDNRGTGRTDSSSSPYSIELLADDVITLLDALAIEQADMVGISMGAAIIQSIGIHYPTRIRKGVMITPFATLPINATLQMLSTAKLFASGVAPALVVETMLPWLFSNDYLSDPKKIEEAINNTLNQSSSQTTVGYQGQFQALINFDSTAELEKIKAPLLLIVGEEDLFTPMYCTHILMEKLPNKVLRTIPKVGHMPHIEALNKVVESIHAFCQSE